MYKWFEKHLAFSRRELNGVCALVVVLLFLWGFSYVFPLRQRESRLDLATKVAEIDAFLATAEIDTENGGNMAAHDIEETLDVSYFPFDPNGLPVVDWKRLGLSERQIRMIKNYEAKGGRFRTKSDLAKIYAINDADYARLEPYIVIKSEMRAPKSGPDDIDLDRKWGRGQPMEPTALRQTTEMPTIELNDADSLVLQYLPGIGPVFASRIVRYRDLLGGFHHVAQLMDVYGFDSARFSGLQPYIAVDTTKVKKISLNSADYRDFRNHPFFNHKLANAIVQYRKQHGPYQAIDDLLKIVIVDEQIFRKIVPYLTLDND